jgi:hypothetical protein
MAEPHAPEPFMLVVAMFSRHETALAWARSRLEKAFGPVALSSPSFDFTQTSYYEATMGPHLRKELFAFEKLVPADGLAAIKLHTNNLEKAIRESDAYSEKRPLNLDPGALSLGKFSLATTKDQAHRVYLGQGVYAEPTLRFQDGTFACWPWTYADYREPVVVQFLNAARELYRRELRRDRRDA